MFIQRALYSLLLAAAALHAVAGFQPSFRSSRGLHSALRSSTETEKAEATGAKSLALFSPCKINLFLRIIRKREDGFHDLASLFQAIGFGDKLELTKVDGVSADEFDCNMQGVPKDSTNLVLRALELMREKTGVEQYFNANLIKQVPAQAGLGGGSANAATAMWGANELMGRPATLEQVSDARLALSLFVFFQRHLIYIRPCLDG